jgi:hypothetical protein
MTLMFRCQILSEVPGFESRQVGPCLCPMKNKVKDEEKRIISLFAKLSVFSKVEIRLGWDFVEKCRRR